MEPTNKAPQKQKKRRIWILAICSASILLIAVIAFITWPRTQQWGMEQIYTLHYEALIERYSAENDLDPFLVMGLIQAESSFRADAISPVGAAGLMQIMPSTAEWLAELMEISYTEADLFNPAYNIRMGTFYLRRLINYFGYVDTALAAYNAGMGNVRGWLEQVQYSYDGETLHTIPFAETRAYVPRVNRYMEIFRELYGP